MKSEQASTYARIALGHVAREYPYSLQHTLASDADALPPRSLHPAFFGSYDWHSCVHGWWLLLNLRNEYRSLPEAGEIEILADLTFTEAKMQAELAYFERPQSGSFERPYGWAWLFYLHLEASKCGEKEWCSNLEPLARLLARRLRGYLAKLTYPITVGTHFNTAFALVMANEWALEFDHDLVTDIVRWSRATFGERRDYCGWEPGGDEFLSPVLVAALLMTRVLPANEWAEWFEQLVIANGWLERECLPVMVSDRSDGKIAHLDGLNLSRAWCLWEMAPLLQDRPKAQALITRRGEEHLAASLPHLAGDYMGEHWLASFARLALRARP